MYLSLMQRFVLYFLFSVQLFQASAQSKTDAFLQELIRSNASPLLLRVLDKPDSFHYQLIYTRIDRDRHNVPHFHNFYLHVDSLDYFNPASTVKMPLAFLALEKMDGLARYGVDKYTPMLTDSAYPGESTAWTDTSAVDGLPSLAQYIRKIFLVSDNDAYNRLYEFLGQARSTGGLLKLAFPDIGSPPPL